MSDQPDTRRVCDLNGAELLDAAMQRYADLGWTNGHWVVELHLEPGGHVRRAVPVLIEERPIRATIGRRQLEGVRKEPPRAA